MRTSVRGKRKMDYGVWKAPVRTRTDPKSRSEPNPNIKGKRSFVPKIWKSVKFCEISKCHNLTLLTVVTFLGFCHTVCIFLSFLAKPEMSKKCRKVTNVTNPQPLQGSFQTFRKYLRFEATFCCRFALTNLDTGHVYLKWRLLLLWLRKK